MKAVINTWAALYQQVTALAQNALTKVLTHCPLGDFNKILEK